MNEWWLYVLSTVVTFTSVALKGFQHKNVIGNHQKTVFFTSIAMAVFDFASVTIIVKGGWPIMITSGLGAGFGMLAAMNLHDYIFKRVFTEGNPGYDRMSRNTPAGK